MKSVMTDSSTFKVRTAADWAKKVKAEYESWGGSVEVIPTDMYGHRVTLQKGGDIQKIIEDRNKMHGLD